MAGTERNYVMDWFLQTKENTTNSTKQKQLATYQEGLIFMRGINIDIAMLTKNKLLDRRNRHKLAYNTMS